MVFVKEESSVRFRIVSINGLITKLINGMMTAAEIALLNRIEVSGNSAAFVLASSATVGVTNTHINIRTAVRGGFCCAFLPDIVFLSDEWIKSISAR
ncbi:hypothetical protein [Kordiimonas laminariae]|uniref:hypothetical protein n=1 Tax=Kordiimonas laminariae TaxID=2917717 RepID=UPI001FF47F6E|nr:hypothetical protein [Kordiimonas laminariae]MCK0068082.1 hypothetical protein [Kordiimonas laminariae]